MRHHADPHDTVALRCRLAAPAATRFVDNEPSLSGRGLFAGVPGVISRQIGIAHISRPVKYYCVAAVAIAGWAIFMGREL
jgi:hypothetical protein